MIVFRSKAKVDKIANTVDMLDTNIMHLFSNRGTVVVLDVRVY